MTSLVGYVEIYTIVHNVGPANLFNHYFEITEGHLNLIYIYLLIY